MSMSSFWKGAISGPDGCASMTKCMAWANFALIVGSWFYFPERPITELCVILASLLTQAGAAKWGYHKHVAGQASTDDEKEGKE